MADRIKGITVEIGGDTTGLSKAPRGRQQRNRRRRPARNVNSLLKLDPPPTRNCSPKAAPALSGG